ncbi:GTPase [Archaeoglobales archaeon]|nr:MAG: GTPase [Archaeoglobales archaeon]
MDQIYIYVVGIAGSGKTYLVKAFSDWLDFKKLDNIAINLDPGADNVPYSADIDVREWFTLEDIMAKYEVGPNGAQVIGADLVATIIDEIKDEIEYYTAPYVLIDTPGQMELFVLRSSSEIIVNRLGRDRSAMIYLFDPIVSKTPNGFLSLLFMGSSAVLRLNIPQIPVLSKSDLLSDEELKRIVEWSENPESLYDSLGYERKTMSLELFHLLKDLGLFRPLIIASSTQGFGMDDIYDGIQEVFYGGDDLEKILY